ncbi:proline racemase family protein [Hoeflea sp. YIM 152468]|uniref:proline racemase family protein n=1 Tax=Hoeflea sp. YIM 152468 TaxID=3031759 RepID=UPI0023DC7A04|nr:proline racemase family protein [Hoeflea sp. YIM 152468]MDF1608343.1 proline racemase family protein [Hoeflea sp. YIM 152468]
MSGPLTVIDMHTGGEPLRIVTSGYPDLPKGTILEKRSFVRDNLDHLRQILMFEPRGHADMYGALLVEPDLPGADLAVLFMHNEGYSTMCGHAIVALGRYAVDQGLVPAGETMATVTIECPCGLVRADVVMRDGKAAEVSFESVPSFLFARDRVLTLGKWGKISFDIAYGGAFYALADARQFGLKFGRDPVAAFVDAADALTRAAQPAVPLSHPDADDLAFLYGTILTDGRDAWSDQPTRNVCVFAERQVDRSPTGSGVTARLAAMQARGQIATGQTRVFESIIGSRFSGAVASVTTSGPHQAITARVSGRAFYSGKAEFLIEQDDPLAGGFLVR